MGEVIEYRSPREREEFTAFVGMVIFLGGWAMLFCGLFMAYALLRSRLHAWPPPNEPALPAWPAAGLTLLLVLSSACLHSGYHALRRGEQRASAARVAVSLVLGTSFFAGQAAIWFVLAQHGLSLTSSPFGSLFYGLTGIHLAHVAVGLGALAWLTWRVHRGLTNPARYLALRLWGLYWHFVGVIWLILFVAVYLL